MVSFSSSLSQTPTPSQEFVQCRPASVAGHDAGEGEETLVEAQEAQAQAQATQAGRESPDLSQEGGA